MTTIMKRICILLSSAVLISAVGIGASMFNHAADSYSGSSHIANARSPRSTFSPLPITPQNPQAYPLKYANAPKDSITDPWGQKNRECASYVAWRVDATFHDMPKWDSDGIYKYFKGHEPVSITQHSQASWLDLARAYNIPTGSTPEQNSVAYAAPGAYIGDNLYAAGPGHVMWVDAVKANGSIDVSEYNTDEDGAYHQRYNVLSNQLTFIYFNRNYQSQQQTLKEHR